jgi:hypothetical protein
MKIFWIPSQSPDTKAIRHFAHIFLGMQGAGHRHRYSGIQHFSPVPYIAFVPDWGTRVQEQSGIPAFDKIAQRY